MNTGPGFAASCDGSSDLPEEPLDVETAHIIAPAAKVVYVAADCSDTDQGQQQDFLDAETRVVDQHLADVSTESFSLIETGEFTPATAAACASACSRVTSRARSTPTGWRRSTFRSSS